MILSIYKEPAFDCVPKLVFLQMAMVLISRSAKLLVGSTPVVAILAHAFYGPADRLVSLDVFCVLRCI